MEHETMTEIDQAHKYLLMSSDEFQETLSSLMQDNIVLGAVLYYYQAKGQLERKLQQNKIEVSEAEKSHFKDNSEILLKISNEVKKKPLDQLVKKYNESIILGSLVYEIRSLEANILTYNDYLSVKEKFYNWPKMGIKSDRILLAWKDFSNAIREVEDWLIEKKNAYLPILERLIKVIELNPNAKEDDIFRELSNIPDKEVFYVICNILLTNPLLRKEFLSISLLEQEKLLSFEQTIFKLLSLLERQTEDRSLKGLIILFTKQIEEVRKELIS